MNSRLTLGKGTPERESTAGRNGGPAMSTAAWLRDSFAEERRSRVANGSDLLQYLRDEPLSQEDYVGVSFGNRETLTRLLREGRVKPESEVAYRRALGLVPVARSEAGKGARTAQAKAQGTPDVVPQSGHSNESGVPTSRTQVRGAEPGVWPGTARTERHGAMRPDHGRRTTAVPDPAPEPKGRTPDRRHNERPSFFDRVGNGVEQAVSRTWDALANNKDLHQGVEAGARMAWEASKWTAQETAQQSLESLFAAATVAKGLRAGKAGEALVAGMRANAVGEAIRRSKSLEEEITDLASRMRASRNRVFYSK